MSYLVEAYVSQSGSPSLEDVSRALQAASEGTAVRYVRSILVPGDETFFHLFEGPSVDDVLEVTAQAQIPCHRISEALQ